MRDYQDATRGKRVSFEYALINGQNDTKEEAKRLAKLIRRHKLHAHVNAIPLNPTPGFTGAERSSKERVDRFIAELEDMGVAASVRMRRGIDIDAGCGQLSAEVQGRD